MVRVSEPTISLSKKTNEQNIQATKVSLNEIVDAFNYLSNLVDNINNRVTALESEDDD